jgi:hypothetical protein
MAAVTRGTALEPNVSTALRKLVDEVGTREAAGLLGVSVSAIRQALAGLGVIFGTQLAIETGLIRLGRLAVTP